MRSGIDQGQRQNLVFDQVDQQPVRFNVAFPETCERTGQLVVMVFLVQRNALTQFFNYLIQ